MKHRYTVMFTSYTVKSYCLTREQNCITCPRPPNNSKVRACILPSNPVNDYFVVHFNSFYFEIIFKMEGCININHQKIPTKTVTQSIQHFTSSFFYLSVKPSK